VVLSLSDSTLWPGAGSVPSGCIFIALRGNSIYAISGSCPHPSGLHLDASLLLADAYDAKPKLVIVLVFDQFRAGASAHNEMATTLGDELVLATGGSACVYGVSMKDRAVILTSGHETTGAFWVDHDTGQWMRELLFSTLPRLAAGFGAALQSFI
jgi:hypothetical protein